MRTLFAIFVAGVLFAPSLSTAQADDTCIDCHDDLPDFTLTPHGETECLECHIGADERRHRRGLDPVDCSACHDDIVEEQASSVHGEHGTRHFEGAELPSCESCHGDLHTMVSARDSASPVHAARQGETCGTCHGSGKPAPPGVRTIRPIEAYTASVHAEAASNGHGGPACSDCHTAHSPLHAADPASTIHRSNVPETCGECHRKITRQFERSIHGMAAQVGVTESPVCTDCHGEHRILAVGSPDSPVSATNIPTRVCGPCHADLELNDRYGLAADQVPSYEESFHGLASRGGSQRVANCASCHGVHDILPSSDPDSFIHPDNLATTCGNCHEGAGARFAIGPVHVLADDKTNPVAYWIRAIYIPLIWITVVGMVLHNLLDLVKKTRTYSLWRRRPPENCVIRERMSLPFRITHAAAALSFIVLVITGFALKYPESWWAMPLQAWNNEFRGIVHRVAAVGLMGACLFHFVHIAVSSRARRQMAAFLPKIADFREFGHRMAYNLGRRDTPPAPVRVGYVEKVEYWAALWGTIITVVTGLLLWFENFTLAWLPGWVPDAASTLHFLEAVLATLAILVWHFYFVILDPAVYPMDTAWLTGKPPFARAEERGEVVREGNDDRPGDTPA